ncbi:hypothetical protein LOTGIDRAFT_161416 [Lottia gigantea]|uniref:Uncharacterized protein n=1 Tax=Lottia gigantea TaxID=225164 RepID=V3ZRZ9_LOTGI|nr:hypothetical protein LOTGIDRAFT_161416 [Lottia gigantea]ESO94208.1 hypothetical protein LOTGIDRAFT_161416 [Lottia gigantea]
MLLAATNIIAFFKNSTYEVEEEIQNTCELRSCVLFPYVTLGDKCGLDEGFNKICVNSNAVCSQGLDGIMSCVCDRNYTNIDGQCENVPSKLFVKDFVNETITQGENITIDYELTVLTLNNIQIDTIPNISNNFKYDSSNGELKVWIFNTRNLLLENFMIRMRAVYGDVEVQDSTLVHLHTIKPDIEECTTVFPQQEVTNVTLGDECSFDNDIYKICIDPDTVCSKTEGKCKCDRNHAEIDGQCVELPDKLFSNKYEYQVILANIEPNKALTLSYYVPGNRTLHCMESRFFIGLSAGEYNQSGPSTERL